VHRVHRNPEDRMKVKWGNTKELFSPGTCAKCGRNSMVVGVNANDFVVYKPFDPAYSSASIGPIVRFLCPHCIRG